MVDDWDNTGAISDLMDFRKINGAADAVLRNLSATELYLKRARQTVAKMMVSRPGHRHIGSSGSLGHDGGIVTSRDISLAALRKHRQNVQELSRSSQPVRLDICH